MCVGTAVQYDIDAESDDDDGGDDAHYEDDAWVVFDVGVVEHCALGQREPPGDGVTPSLGGSR